MKIQILSDIHNEFIRGKFPDYDLRVSNAYTRRKGLCSPAPLSTIEKTDSDVVVLAGDVDLGATGVQWAVVESQILAKDIIYVAGNHEFYDREYFENILSMRKMSNNTRVHVLENNSVVINGVRFLGCTLWTDYKVLSETTQHDAMKFIKGKLSDHSVIRIKHDAEKPALKFKPADALTIHKESVEWLKNELDKSFEGKTVVITHHGPSKKCAHYKYGVDEYGPGFYSDLEYLMGGNVDLWIYGHTHSNLDTIINGTRLISNQPGYINETVPGFNPHLVVSI